MAARRTGKCNITLSLDKEILRQARGAAAKHGMSVSAFLARELGAAASREDAYEKAKASALALLDSPMHMGGLGIGDREAFHDRKNLR
jgi:hypothetical protein